MGHKEALQELDRLESEYKLQDPRTAPAEVRRLVEDEMRAAGLTSRPASVKPNETYRKQVYAAANKFMAAHPATDPAGFEPSEANERKMFDWIEANGMDGTQPHHFEMAFAALRATLAPPALRRPAAPRVRKVDGIEISHESLDRLDAKTFNRLMENPAFVAAVNALPPRRR
jgi:hypothetical protein